MELITLATPVVRPSRVSVVLTGLNFDLEGQAVTVTWRDNNNERFSAFYPTPAGPVGPTGAALLTALNTANLTSNSLLRRTLLRLQADGYIPAGTVSGTPD